MNYKNLEEFKENNGYDIDGSWYPRVTKIVGIKSKPALHYFYASLRNYAEGERIKEISADEGTRVHEAVQDLMIGRDPEIDEDILPSVDAFVNFWEKNKGKIEIDPDSIEKRVTNIDHRYSGTVDGIALIDGQVGVLDIKTSQDIYRDYRLQTSAYVATLNNQKFFDNKKLETRWILRIDQHKLCQLCGARLRTKGGRSKVKIDWNNPFMRSCNHIWGNMEGDIELKEFDMWEYDFEAFLGAKKLWEWENKDWLEEVGYL